MTCFTKLKLHLEGKIIFKKMDNIFFKSTLIITVSKEQIQVIRRIEKSLEYIECLESYSGKKVLPIVHLCLDDYCFSLNTFFNTYSQN